MSSARKEFAPSFFTASLYFSPVVITTGNSVEMHGSFFELSMLGGGHPFCGKSIANENVPSKIHLRCR